MMKKEYVKYIRSLKKTLDHGLELKKVHKVITFNQKTCIKSDIAMNTELRKKSKK